MTKKILTADKDYPFMTNDGYMVSEWFCNPNGVKKQLNSL